MLTLSVAGQRDAPVFGLYQIRTRHMPVHSSGWLYRRLSRWTWYQLMKCLSRVLANYRGDNVPSALVDTVEILLRDLELR